MEANWIQIQTRTTYLSHVDCDPDLNPDSGPVACVNAALERKAWVQSQLSLLILAIQFTTVALASTCMHTFLEN